MPEPTDVRKRLLTILGIFVGVFLALFLFIAVIRRDKNIPPDTGKTTDGTATSEQGGIQASVPRAGVPQPTKPVVGDPEDLYLKQLSRNFVERFGSYSNQNDNTHIVDAVVFATPRMQTYLESQEQEAARVYSGVTTKVIVSRIEKKSGVEATVDVDVQRIIRDNGSERTEYQSGSVSLLKVNGEWKVDGLFWK